MEEWWETVNGAGLAQGDVLLDCLVPVMPDDVSLPTGSTWDYTFQADLFDLIVLTQSCDLENDKAPLVALCPIFTLDVWEAANAAFRQRGRWEQVRQGRIEGLHLLAAFEAPDDNRQAIVVDFRQIYSLPIGYVRLRASTLGARRRLRSPYLEHFSQGFARFFMRVGLPSNIPPFR
jgi:hypothetical protein